MVGLQGAVATCTYSVLKYAVIGLEKKRGAPRGEQRGLRERGGEGGTTGVKAQPVGRREVTELEGGECARLVSGQWSNSTVLAGGRALVPAQLRELALATGSPSGPLGEKRGEELTQGHGLRPFADGRQPSAFFPFG